MSTASTSEPISVHRTTLMTVARGSDGDALLFLLGTMGPLLLGIFGALKPPLGPWFYVFLGSCTLLPLLGVRLWILFGRVTKWVKLFEDQMVWEDPQGEHQLRWDEVAEVYRHEVRRGSMGRAELYEAELTIVLKNGGRVVLNQTLAPFNKMATLVQSLSARAILDDKRREFEEGEARFGPLALRPDGIDFAGELLPWEELEHYALWDGEVYFFTTKYQGRNCKAALLSRIPNYLVMLKMMEDLGHLPSKPEECVPSARG